MCCYLILQTTEKLSVPLRERGKKLVISMAFNVLGAAI
jgi:hypothetical protein